MSVRTDCKHYKNKECLLEGIANIKYFFFFQLDLVKTAFTIGILHANLSS